MFVLGGATKMIMHSFTLNQIKMVGTSLQSLDCEFNRCGEIWEILSETRTSLLKTSLVHGSSTPSDIMHREENQMRVLTVDWGGSVGRVQVLQQDRSTRRNSVWGGRRDRPTQTCNPVRLSCAQGGLFPLDMWRKWATNQRADWSKSPHGITCSSQFRRMWYWSVFVLLFQLYPPLGLSPPLTLSSPAASKSHFPHCSDL